MNNNSNPISGGVGDIFSPGKARRLSGRKYSPIKRHERKRSYTLGHKMDTTIISDIEYINFLPDAVGIELEDSSFLKSSFVDKSGGIKKVNKGESFENTKLES